MAIGFGQLSDGFIGLSQQVMGDVVGGVHFGGAIEVMQGLDGLLELEERLAEEDVGAGSGGLEQHSAIQRLLRFSELAAAQIGVAQPVIGFAVERIDFAFCFEFADGAG